MLRRAGLLIPLVLLGLQDGANLPPGPAVTYTLIEPDVLVLSSDPERVKVVREGLQARYDWAWWRDRAAEMERGWNREGENHRVTRLAYEDLLKRHEAGVNKEAEPLRARLERIRSTLREALDDPPDVTFDRPELPPVGPPRKEDPDRPEPL